MKTRKKLSKPKVDISSVFFNKILGYCFSSFSNRAFIKKLNAFYSVVDTSHFKEDVDIGPLYDVTVKFIKLFLTDSIDDRELIIEKILDESIDDDDEEDNIADILTNALDYADQIKSGDAIAIENMVIERYNYVNTIPHLEQLSTLIDKVKKGDFGSYGDAMKEVHLASLNFNKALTARSTANVSFPELSLNRSDFKETFSKIYTNITNEKRTVKTGIQRFNKILSGGFQPGRVYIFLGCTGGWKSSLLLNICFWGVKYNKEMPCLDQAKLPLILYISQENSLEETVERMLSYVGATDAELKINKNVDDSYELIFKEFMEDSPVELRMMYKPKNSISTADLDTIVNDIESEGEYEVKAVVHDYLKRIRPEVPSGDLRIDLGEAVNDFAVFAKNRKIPVISANQMNAAAYKVLEAGLEENEKNAEKKDLAKGLSITMQSESQMISENADAIFGINREFSKTLGKWFLTIKDLKNRGSKSNRDSISTYFVHPFEVNNSMRLQEDFNKKKPLSLNSVSDALEGFSKKEESLPEKEYVASDNSFFEDDDDLIES